MMQWCFLMAMLVIAGAAGCTRGTTVVEAPEENGTILGRVIDAKTRAPIVAVAIVVIPARPETTTDATGHFEIRDLPLGEDFIVTANKPGYISSSVTVPVTRAQPIISIEFTLTRIPG